MISLRVNDIKQYAYCPRVVFYQYCMPVNKQSTWKMEQGKNHRHHARRFIRVGNNFPHPIC